MNRRDFLKSTGVTLAALATGSGPARVRKARAVSRSLAASRPNIVFILADDMAYKDLSAYGQQARQTPNLDRLALGGVRFTQAYAFIRQNKNQPFFLYYASQIPHGPVIAKELGRFKDEPWDIKHREWARQYPMPQGRPANGI